MAIRINFIHARTPSNRGIRNGDYLVSIDGQTRHMTTRQMHNHLQLNRDWGDNIELVVRRGNQNVNLRMKLPDKPRD